MSQHNSTADTSEERQIRELEKENARLRQQLAEWSRIVPRRIRLPGGRALIWRCPDDMVPTMPEYHLPEASEKDVDG